VIPTVILSVVGVVLLVFYLSLFPAKGFTAPIGWDASEYLWRTRLAQAQGLDATTVVMPTVSRPKSGRPGYLVVGATLSSLGRVDPVRLEMVMSSVLALVIALAAGALVAGGLRRRSLDLCIVALLVGLSPPVIRLMMPEGYLDTMLAGGVFGVAALAVLVAVEDRRALAPAILLLGSAAILHWSIFSIMAATLGLFAALLVPMSWRSWRGHTVGLLDTPTARVGEVLLGGGVFATGLLFGVLGQRLPTPRTDVSEFAKKLKRDLPKYHLAITLPAAAVGAASLAGPARMAALGPRDGKADEEHRRSWYMLALLLSWCAVVLGGYVARRFFHVSVPAHRFLSFGLALPILVGLGLLWVARLAGRRWRLAAIAILAVGLGVGAFVAHAQWWGAKPFIQRLKVQDAGLAAAYLEAEHVPASRPVVLILGPIDWNNVGLTSHTTRAALPPDRLASLYLYVGSPQDYLARRPIDTDVSRSYFRAIAPLYARDPVAILLASYDPQAFAQWVDDHPETLVGPRIAVLSGPVHPTALAPVAPPVGPIPAWRLGVMAIGAALVLAAIGLGWTLVGFRRWLRPIELLAAAPAVGVAALVFLGSMADRAGVRLHGWGGAAVPVVAALLGWGALALSVRRRAVGPAAEPVTAPARPTIHPQP
jgi:hypothetical protein